MALPLLGYFFILAAAGPLVLFAAAVARRRREALAKASKRIRRDVRDANPLLLRSGLDLAKMLRRGEVTSLELVDIALAQLEKVNPDLNAIVAFRPKKARRRAKWCDKILAQERERRLRSVPEDSMDEAGGLPPFLGVPCIVKECFEVEGMPFTAGIVERGKQNVVGTKYCKVMKRLRDDGGAVILGVGNISEACMWMESSNPVHGVSSNPYDLARTPGGSSGGNASAVAAAGVPFAISSDVGGSIRIPCAFTGLFGHKPTGGLVPNDGTIPETHGKVKHYCQIGPMARHAFDLLPLLQILCKGRFYPTNIHFEEMRVIDLRQPFASTTLPTSPQHPDIAAAQDRVVRYLERERGCTIVRPRHFKELETAFEIWAACLGEAQPSAFAKIISEGKGGNAWLHVFWDLAKWILTCGRGSEHTLAALALAVVEPIDALDPRRKRFIKACETLQRSIEINLGRNGILICPTWPTPAPLHGPLPHLLYSANAGYTGIFNVLEFPSTAVPMGLTTDTQLPISLQIVSNRMHDNRCIAVACALQYDGVTHAPMP